MKKRIAAVLLIVLMLLPALASCNKEVEDKETEVTVYTLFLIKDESTTDEAIKRVNIALNRILYYRLGTCVELIAYTEDEYYDAIEAKYAEMEAYEEEKAAAKKNKNNKDTSDASAATSDTDLSDVSEDVFTGDDYLDLLDAGGEYVRNKPRFDIFLINDYQTYYEFASKGLLSSISDTLSSECKVLNDYIHPTILSAAKVGKKTYGIPVNTTLGEYTYIVFDQELLDKYSVDYQTMMSIEDLQDYLALIAENEPDVVPLANTADPTDLDFIFNSLSPAYVQNKYVHSTFESETVAKYYSVIEKFSSLGYLREAGSDDRCAVQFVTGNEETITALKASTGRDYAYSVYRNPVATNENAIQSIFCFSSYCTANELVAAAELMTEIYTDPDLANILAYGVEGIDYELNDDNQVVRLSNDYVIDTAYSGNPFITYTLAGEDADKWEKAKQQNLDATLAADIGFSFAPYEFKFTYKEENEEGKEEEKELILSGPDYVSIINGIAADYYDAIVRGTALSLDLEALQYAAETGIEDTLRKSLESAYATRLQNNFSTAETAKYAVGTAIGNKMYAEAADTVNNSIFSVVENELRTKYTAQFKAELENTYEKEEELNAEVTKRVNALLTEDFINEAIEQDYGQDYIDDLIESQYNREVTSLVDTALRNYINTDEYANAYAAAITSAAFDAELAEMLNSDLTVAINDSVNELISEYMLEYMKQIIDASEIALTEAIDAYVAEVLAASAKYDEEPMTEDEIRYELGLMKKEVESSEDNGDETSNEDEDEEEEENKNVTYVPVDISMYEFAINEITEQYYELFGNPTSVS